MSLKIPKQLKSEFKQGFKEYIKAMGDTVVCYLKPTAVDCPNCIFDPTVGKSSNIYNHYFNTPVAVFSGTEYSRLVYPAPFNIPSVSGVQYDPALTNPKILKAAICPVCLGQGVLTYDNKVCILGVVTQGVIGQGMEAGRFFDLSAGRDGMPVVRVKTDACNTAICNSSVYFVIQGESYKVAIPVKVKGLGGEHIAEMYLSEIANQSSSTSDFNSDPRININTKGSDPIPNVPPAIPPVVPSGIDVW